MTATVTDVAGLKVHALGGPATAPILVLLHANGDSAACWPDAVRRWSPHYRVLGVDLCGHGGSPPFTPDQLREPGDVFVADATAVLAGIRAASPAGTRLGAVGHSLGGAALTAACAANPALVDVLVLIDPPWDWPVLTGSRPHVGAERVRLVRAYVSDPEGELAAHRRAEPRWGEDERVAWIACKADLDLAYVATGGGRPSTPWTQHVPILSTPTLLVTGDGDVIVGPESRRQVAAFGNPQVEVRVVTGADHYVRQQLPDEFHAVVDPWLAERLGS